MPPQGSTTAAGVDTVFNFIFWLSLFFFALIVGQMLLFIIRYRRRAGVEAEKTPTHSTPLELTWLIIPLVLVIVIFYLGFKTFLDIRTPPKDAYEVQVTGQAWKWLFTYPNGYVDENLHVPAKTPVKLVMTSEDFIHSFYVPAFRMKMDVVPGRYSHAWFQAVEPGTYQIFCAEYCGTGHSDMMADVIVHPEGEFEKWLEDASNFLDRMSPQEAGALLYNSRGCKQCHKVDGGELIGPPFNGLFGKLRVFQDGSRLEADENYLRESILNPQEKIVAGYEPVMPTYRGRLKDQEITAIIAYIKSLQ